MQVAVNHDNRGGVIVQIPDNDRHGFFLCQFTGPMPPVSGYQLIAAAGVRTGDSRNKNAVLPDAVRCFHHGIIIFDLEGVSLERVQLAQRDFYHLFPPRVGAAFLGGKQIIDRCQLYFFRAAFQVSTPPWSDLRNPPLLCRLGHGRKCSCPLR